MIDRTELAPVLDPQKWSASIPLELASKAMLIREVEQRLLELFGQARLFGTVHTCIGQEWSGIAVCESLREGDLIFSNHRCHGHYLAWTDDVEGLIAEIMGKETGMCGGRGGSQHICSKGFFSNGIQGGIVPVATGLALSQRMRETGNISVVFIGDGTLGEGAVYESMNIASKWGLPLLIVLENNLYAQTTPQEQGLAGDICARAAAFGIESCRNSTWDPMRLLSDAARCVAKVRDECRPLFLQIDTYRLMAHSKGDDNRDPAEVRGFLARDPLTRFAEEQPSVVDKMYASIRPRVDLAVNLAETATYASNVKEQGKVGDQPPPSWQRTRIERPERIVNLIHDSLERNMRRDGRIVILGEDIEAPGGGAFKVTKRLSENFPGRVRNTPISEAAIVGMGNGLALSGHIPVCEIMFGDFLTLASDQLINHAAKFQYMYNDQVRVPLIVRTPMGGKRGYGPTHSQSLEKHFVGLPGTQMLALHHRHDPGAVYDRLFESIDRPTIVIENKLLYGVKAADECPDGFVLEHTDALFPTTRMRPLGRPDVTIVAYGGMLADVENAAISLFDEHELICEVIVPMLLFPLDIRPIVDSVRSSRRLLIVEEGAGFAALGAEVIAQVAEAAPEAIQTCQRLAGPDHPIPACGPLERDVLPGVKHIVDAVRELVAHE